MGDEQSLESALASGKPLVCFTVGDSMEPLLYNRETCVVICRTARALRPGDLALYKRPAGRYVLHRVIRADETVYYTRGDNRYGLERVPREWVIAVATEVYRRGKHILVTDGAYRLYVWAWNFLYPLRWCCYHARGLVRSRMRGAKDL